MNILKNLPWVGAKINKNKLRLIDHVFSSPTSPPTSFADLGGVWNVDGAYTFYTLRNYDVKKAYLVDTNFTDVVLKNAKSNNNLELIGENFGEKTVADKLGDTEAVFLFDVLLHQVKPDWNEILEMYAKKCKYFLIYNQQWTGSKETVRLLDLGRDEYFKNVPHDKYHPSYIALFEKMNEIHPDHNRKWRDIHNVWQWGITDIALISVMKELGFKVVFNENCGQFASLPNFEDHMFVFQKI